MPMHESARDQVDALPMLEGEDLSAVTFVRDYVQLHFDGPVVTAYTLPRVVRGGVTVAPGEPGFRDALCARIGRVVTSARAVRNERFELVFDDGASVVVPLTPESYRGAEAVMFHDADGRTWGVW